MTKEKGFLDYKFLGIKPFTLTLDENHIEYVIFQDSETILKLFCEREDILNRDEDLVKTGKCVNDEIEVYFAQFGIKITKSYLSYIVFIYDHHPLYEDLLTAADSLEEIISMRLDSIDPSEISSIQ